MSATEAVVQSLVCKAYSGQPDPLATVRIAAFLQFAFLYWHEHPAGRISSSDWLPPTYEVRREVIFSVCLSAHQGGTPILSQVLPGGGGGGAPILSQVLPGEGVPWSGQCYPSPPAKIGQGYPLSQDMGTHPDRLRRGQYTSWGFPQADFLVPK